MNFNINTMYFLSAGQVKTNLQYVQICRKLLLIKQNTEVAICWHTLHKEIPSGNFSLFSYNLFHL